MVSTFQTKLESLFGARISTPAICRTLRSMGCTRQVMRRVAIQRSDTLRARFVIMEHSPCPRSCWFDWESGWSQGMFFTTLLTWLMLAEGVFCQVKSLLKQNHELFQMCADPRAYLTLAFGMVTPGDIYSHNNYNKLWIHVKCSTIQTETQCPCVMCIWVLWSLQLIHYGFMLRCVFSVRQQARLLQTAEVSQLFVAFGTIVNKFCRTSPEAWVWGILCTSSNMLFLFCAPPVHALINMVEWVGASEELLYNPPLPLSSSAHITKYGST